MNIFTIARMWHLYVWDGNRGDNYLWWSDLKPSQRAFPRWDTE